MRQVTCSPVLFSTVVAIVLGSSLSSSALAEYPIGKRDWGRGHGIQLGPRPQFLVNDMTESALKEKLQACLDKRPKRTRFSIGHRGAPLQFPEHTQESYEAGHRMGAGILECDVTFTRDKELVCRHAQNDLATTTNILLTDLADTCITPFTPAVIADDGSLVSPASAECRTSEITLAEFKSLRGKMDAFNPRAQTPEEFVGGTANWRTDLYASATSGALLTHAESIELFKELGVNMTPELKAPSVEMPFDGFTQEDYAQKMIDEYKAAGVAPRDVWVQSFNRDDVLYWIANEPEFGRQAVFLEGAVNPSELPGFVELANDRASGINVVAPPVFALLTLDADNNMVPSEYAQNVKALGFKTITWSLERSGILADGNNGFYYQTIDPAISREGDVMEVIDTLAQDVGVIGIFSDWPATVSFYASCMNLKRDRTYGRR
ncbi:MULTISPECIES: glycerophosphodiester phosphodiesterase family protein [unclassified Microbulbifer]|uniref:glycerophosphodiester phosphodiesterase family protein n=1 Tax=unclassified Microbulbifer TaxID=2619833 RepID=UPI0027E4635B|nr:MULTISPECIES: glycerophosphodiester phosphodiesterase family protein [unclassified Microbulbifer]